jgi:hypothetical protein
MCRLKRVTVKLEFKFCVYVSYLVWIFSICDKLANRLIITMSIGALLKYLWT